MHQWLTTWQSSFRSIAVRAHFQMIQLKRVLADIIEFLWYIGNRKPTLKSGWPSCGNRRTFISTTGWAGLSSPASILPAAVSMMFARTLPSIPVEFRTSSDSLTNFFSQSWAWFALAFYMTTKPFRLWKTYLFHNTIVLEKVGIFPRKCIALWLVGFWLDKWKSIQIV